MADLSVAEAARRARRSPRTVLRAINSGGLPAERFGERGWWVIDEADLQAFVVKSGKDAGSAAVSNRGEATLGPCG